MTSGVVRASLEELFSNAKFGWFFYLFGTIVLGILGMFLESQGIGKATVIWTMAGLVIPLAVALYAAKEYLRKRREAGASELEALEKDLLVWRYVSRGLSVAMVGVVGVWGLAETGNLPVAGNQTLLATDYLVRVVLVLAILHFFADFKTDELSKSVLAWIRRLRNVERPKKELSEMSKEARLR